jgi:HAD superfamily hydrolase (TIGR01509 family)
MEGKYSSGIMSQFETRAEAGSPQGDNQTSACCWRFVIKALIFDFDGLMIDTETPEVQFWQDLFARHGQEFPLDEWVHSVVGSSLANLDPVTRLEQLTGLQIDRQAVDEQRQRTREGWQSVLPLLPGVADTLEAARRLGLRMAVASSSLHSWVDVFLRRLEFNDLFEAVICRGDVARVKPDPDLFLAALSALHVRAEQALAFEDSPNGIRAAQAAGLRVVGIANPISARLGTLRADLTLNSMSDMALPDLLAHFGDKLALRPETPDDIAGIRAVNECAFDTKIEADLVDLCRQRGKMVLSLAALLEEQVVGHVLFTPVSCDPGSAGRGGASTGLGLGPIAVLPEFQGTGIGSRLMCAGLDQARRSGCDFVVLLGDPAYYSRFGFRPASDFGLSSEYGGGDAFQVLELRPGALAGRRGEVKYIPEFGESGC